jgi:nitrogen fixation NifU-like protein
MGAIDEEQVYQEHVLEHFDAPYHRGRCELATHAHEGDNPLCGDTVRLELRVTEEDRIGAAWFEGDGCCISQAAASMLVEHIEGKTLEEAREFSAQDMLELFRARLTPNRQKCCLLSWRVLQTAMHAAVSRAPHSPADLDDDDLDDDCQPERPAEPRGA